METPELDRLADAITDLANVRARIPLDRLLRETALNILILTRIATNRLPDRQRRDDIDESCDHLVTQLRQCSWELPPGKG
ncbi:hypothetical protein [Glycomyces buryatensis]|uniref:Uncharacterized protein n=1 Tax=Glycomyces buryatensis TaxID=2570927 RepID=A0A4S8QFM0_9ACTN|nr:hypothetical protein [Glycomyces buryatensis]THV43487.1 hypothetical protein FAB82_00010 [Glycomyces buryatensis]